MLRCSLRRTVLQLCIVLTPLASQAQDLASLNPIRGDFVKSPPGFRSACLLYDWLCEDAPERGVMLPEEEILRVVRSVNRSVNRAVKQMSDVENYGTIELWTLPERGRGDCEDIALEKMRRLLQHGVPPDRLSMAIALDRHGDNHAVLLVRAQDGYLVLDSLTDRILAPGETGYRMLAMQSSENRLRWRVANAVAPGSPHMPVPQSDRAERRITSAIAGAIRD